MSLPESACRPSPQRPLDLACTCLVLAVLASCTRLEESYYDNGVLRSRGQVDVPGGERHGEWMFQHPNGEPKERGSYEHGLRTGVWTQWYPDGQPRSRGARQPDRATASSPRHGPWIFWHENGIVAARGVYDRGSREGCWELSIVDGGLDGDHSGVHHEGVLLGVPPGGREDDDEAAPASSEDGADAVDKQD